MNELPALESLLFVAGEEGLSIEEASALLGIYPDRTRYLMERLKWQLATQPLTALTIRQVNGRFQLTTKVAYGDVVKQYAQSPFAARLTQSALETLAIIAYEAPVTRMAIDQIRGVHSSGILKKLMQHGLIEEKGRQDSPGHPILYGVTDYFYQYFGLNSLDDLPAIEALMTNEKAETHDLYARHNDMSQSDEESRNR
ncbi:MAG: SMC-Scp complex subunit ScpB [Aerococcus sp.]|nr:SMC-Scp complex subunit ScpB [Aerococcus sp.]